MRVFDCCTRIHFIISTHRSQNKSCAHQFPLTHKTNVDVKYFPYSIQSTTTWSKSINSLSDFSFCFERSMKWKCLLFENEFVFDFFETKQLHAKWCQHYHRVNSRYRLVNHFANTLACIWHYSPICFVYFRKSIQSHSVRLYDANLKFFFI